MPRLLKSKSWLSHWEEYMSDTEAPIEYNTWCGITAILATLKRNVWIERPKFKLYPNIYTILVGPPGVGKGTAINPLLEVLNIAGTANISPDRITAEELIKSLADGFGAGIKTTAGKVSIHKDSTTIIAATELPIYLNSSNWTLELMCELWDNKPMGTSYSTKTKGSFTATDTCVSLVGGCVPDFIRKINKDAMSAVTGGFTTRCIFVYAGDKIYKDPWKVVDQTIEKKMKDALANDLVHISTLQGEIKFTLAAQTMWTKHVNGVTNNQDPFESEVLAGFKSRNMAHTFKAAMALSVAESDKLVIDDRHMYNAIGLVNKVRDKIDIVFRCVGESPIAMAQDRVLTFVDREGIVSRSKILRYLGRHITDEDLTKVMRVLVGSGLVKEIQQGNQMMFESTQVKGFKVKGASNP